MKKLIATIIILIFLVNVTPVAAGETVTEERETKAYHPIYQAIDDYDFLLAPLSCGVVGLQYGGLYGGVAGVAIGSIDELLNYFEVTDKHYLTAGILGIGTATKFELPYYLGESVGSIVGITAASGKANRVIEKSFPIAFTAIAGQSYAGKRGCDRRCSCWSCR